MQIFLLIKLLKTNGDLNLKLLYITVNLWIQLYSMKLQRLLLCFVLISAALIFFNQCTSADADGASIQVFRFNELGAVTSLDPALAGSFENNWALNQLYNGLVEMDTSLAVKGCIARNWNISDDGLQYVFQLRTDVFFHDSPQFPAGKGRKVTANDFVYSFNRLFDKKISNASTLVDGIALEQGTGTPIINATNDSTLTIRLTKHFEPFLGMLTMKYFSVVPKEVVQFYKGDFGIRPIGTGPFQLKVWKDKASLVLEKNTHYFKFDEKGIRLPYLDLIAVSFIKDPDAAFMQFMSGELDMISGIDAINKEKVFEKDGQLKESLRNQINLISEPFLKTDYFGILIDQNLDLVKNSPMRLKLIRQAINYAIDRDKIVRYRRFNLGTPASNGFIPPGMNAYDSKKIIGYHYDQDKARELLDKAGFPAGKGMMPITITTTATYMDIAEDVANQLKSVGIKIEIDLMPPSAFKSAVADSKLMIFRKSWICDYPDPENFMSLFYSKNFSPAGVNYSHFTNSEFDRFYERCLVEQNDSIRSELFLKMDQIIIEESPIIPLYYDQIVRLVQKRVAGLLVDPTNTLNLEMVRVN